MSFEVSTYEELELHNLDSDTKEIADSLVNYLEQFNHMTALEYLYIGKLRLTVDGETVLLEGIKEEEPCNTYVLHGGRDGNPMLDQKQTERTLWPNDSPVVRLIHRIPGGKEISLELSFLVSQLIGTHYGYAFFRECLGKAVNADKLANNVTYKCLEYYDTSDEVVSYRFEKKAGKMLSAEPDATEDLSVVADIKDWYGNNFQCIIEGDEPVEEPEREEMVQKATEWFSLFTDDEEFEDEDEGCFYICTVATFTSEQLPTFQGLLQDFYDFALRHESEFTLVAEFTPDSQFEFARLTFSAEDGKIVARAMRY